MKFERARTNEQITERRKEIIESCSKLFDEFGVEGVHFKAISKMTSIGRSTIYNYYKTKEDILLDLLVEDIRKWSNGVVSILNEHDSLSKESYCRKITDSFLINSRMLYLMSIHYSFVEKNCTLEKLTEFKRNMNELVSPLTRSIDKYFPNAQDDKKRLFFFSLVSFISGLYPSTNLTEKQKQAIKDSGYKHHNYEFEETCYEGLFALASMLD